MESRKPSSGSLHSKQASGCFGTMEHANPGVASIQDKGISLYYEISSIQGTGATCAIICFSSSGAFYRPPILHTDAEISSVSRLDLEGYPQLAGLIKDAASIRLFHLQSIENFEGEKCCPGRRDLSLKSTPQP